MLEKWKLKNILTVELNEQLFVGSGPHAHSAVLASREDVVGVHIERSN